MVPQHAGKLLTVGAVLMDAQLDVLAKMFIELLVVVLVLSELIKELHARLNQDLADDLQDLVLLQRLSGDVEGEVLKVDDVFDIEVLRDELLTVVHDKDPTIVELDVVLGLLVPKEVEGSALWDEEESAELHMALNREVLDAEMLPPVIGEGLVELSVLLLGDVVRVPGPEGLCLVQLLVLRVLFLKT